VRVVANKKETCHAGRQRIAEFVSSVLGDGKTANGTELWLNDTLVYASQELERRQARVEKREYKIMLHLCFIDASFMLHLCALLMSSRRNAQPR